MDSLSIVALLFIPVMVVMIAALIVFLGTLPGKIARKREHPWSDAVNAASWIGLVTGVLWPFAFVWAFLPLPRAASNTITADQPADEKDNGGGEDNESLQEKIDALEEELARVEAERSETGGEEATA